MPRTTVKRRLKRLESWDIVYHHGRLYHVRETMLNSLFGMRSYLQIRRMISKAGEELTALDAIRIDLMSWEAVPSASCASAPQSSASRFTASNGGVRC